ncbi:MAG: hypothetical protein ACK5Q7_16285, partial [Cyanobacteriota bacterium]
MAELTVRPLGRLTHDIILGQNAPPQRHHHRRLQSPPAVADPRPPTRHCAGLREPAHPRRLPAALREERPPPAPPPQRCHRPVEQGHGRRAHALPRHDRHRHRQFFPLKFGAIELCREALQI